ncbi:DNA polymerase III subunit delta [Oceaniserpentilla sp. 4NH20-0058]|uniref:DNA polymerase III subunit delta n=1 Tax=Oceaniserpentilla sp. 4NH20-0058 TaxID=3127660 RepID=UPI003107E050
MRLKPEQLHQHLQKELKPLYIVSGDEPLLAQEICDQIRAHAKSQGFDEREVHHVEGNFKWGELLEAANALSLFSSRKLMEIRIDNGKPGDQGSKALVQLFDNPNPDTIVLLVLPKLDKSATNTKWFKALDKIGVFIQHWPMERNQLPGWLANRLRQQGMKADRDALALLADRTDGNLLAAAQEIEKLKLLGLSEITAKHIEAAVGDASRYDVFALSEAAFKGDTARSLHILGTLQGEGIHALQPLAILTNDIRQLMSFMQLVQAGTSDDKALQQLKVFWPKKQSQIKGAARRLNVTVVQECLTICKQVDQSSKNILQDDPWRLISSLITKLCGLNIIPNRIHSI